MSPKKKEELTLEEFEKLTTYEQLAEKLELSVVYLRQLKREEGLPFYPFGTAVRFRISEVEEWLQKRKLRNQKKR